MAEDLLTAVVPVDAAGLLREQWEDAVKNVDLMKIVGYVRSNQTLRSDRKACTAMNAVFQAIGQIQNTGQDLTTGSVKTLQDCKDGLISLIASKRRASSAYVPSELFKTDDTAPDAVVQEPQKFI